MHNKTIFIGIDGGASKTSGVLVDGEGHMLSRQTGPASAVVGKPSQRSCAVLRKMIDVLCSQAGITRHDVAHCSIGLNGIDFADEIQMQHETIAESIDLAIDSLTIVNDGIVALWGATDRPAALIIQHGSGFTAAYRTRWGGECLFDQLNVSDIFDMRMALLSTIARMINGQIEATPLKETVLAYFRITDEAAFGEAVYRKTISKQLLMNTVPLVFQAWLEGDPAAAKLVESAVADYGITTRAMICKLGTASLDVVLGGGIIAQAPPAFWALMKQTLHHFYPEATIKPPVLSPAIGAAILAGHRTGLNPAVLFQRLQSTSFQSGADHHR